MRTSCVVAAMLVCGFAASSSSVRAQTLVLNSTTYGYEVPYYLIQVNYLVVPPYPHYGSRWGYGYRHYYEWVTVAESDDLAEATFIYELYKLAEELYVLDEVAPEIPNAYPVSVRMITEYRPLLLNSR